MPTTDRPAGRPDAARVDVADGDYDELLGVWTLYFDIPRAEAVYFRVVVESWEDLGVTRTMSRDYAATVVPGGGSRSLVVVLAVPDLLTACLRGLALLCEEIGGVHVPSSATWRERLRADLGATAE